MIAHQKNRRADWESVDWTKHNDEIAQLLSRHPDSVAKMRTKFGAQGMAKRKPRRKYKVTRKAVPPPHTQELATAAAKISPKSGRYETNVNAKRWLIISPSGQRFEFSNLQHFVRNHPELFAKADTVWKRQGGKRGTGGEYCNASNGLAQAARLNIGWKGWQAKIIKG
ncbi:hypothetical protein B0181_04965 [Moraxella caviae]|nr:hypothetical protein B0181_04965 [Moraxella caviae]